MAPGKGLRQHLLTAAFSNNDVKNLNRQVRLDNLKSESLLFTGFADKARENCFPLKGLDGSPHNPCYKSVRVCDASAV